ncbi:MAG: UvrB/UvrC motif-containing protein [Candidatus Eisenbacteria bacterium]
MLCDNCGKDPAKIHYKEVKDNEVTEFHLCEKCAMEKGIQVPHKKQPFSISNIFAGMAEEAVSGLESCKGCGLSYKEFRDTGRLGCSECYQAFREQLKPLLRRIHGSNAHIGKSPRMSQGVYEKRREIEDLKVQLGLAIETEDFEKAAELRDRIKELETEPEDISS